MAEEHLGRLRTQACLIRTSIEALLVQAQYNAKLKWEEVLYQFNTLQRQMDDLRDEIVALPLLSYFVLTPGRLPENAEELPMMLSTRELPVMEEEKEVERARAEPQVPFAQIDAHNSLIDDLDAVLSAKPPASRHSDDRTKRPKLESGDNSYPKEWPPFI